jgi:Ni,Fe-hydrogenase III large subunit/Ni,Fe-hydrogenase III component G
MNKKNKWHIEFLERLIVAQIIPKEQEWQTISSLPSLLIEHDKWEQALSFAADSKKCRFVGIWAQDLDEQIQATICLEAFGKHFLLRTSVAIKNPELFSATPHFPAANRLERHMRDMFGIKFIDHPDKRRWTRHKAWDENQFPLRKNFPVAGFVSTVTLPDEKYPFHTITGTGTYEIPVGPIHAGIIEPGHFRFQAAGEDIINLEERLGYVHKGIEKIAEGRDIDGLIKLAARVSGDSTAAHSWAACQACEKACEIKVPERALYLRAIIVERERIANHLGDFAAICNDVGFSFAYYQFMRLKELWLRINAQIFGHRFMMDIIKFGGVAVNLNEENKNVIQQQLMTLKEELEELYPMIENNSSLHDRLKTTGVLSCELANKFGSLGYVGRASGSKLDLRHDAPYAPYNQLSIRIPSYNSGDVLSRTRIRAQEILVSLELIRELLEKLPSGDILYKDQPVFKNVEGIGLIEGWRGEILVYVNINKEGKIVRYFPRDPSWFSWPALEQLIHGNIVPDFPVCNKSINGSYSGVDL